jgi:hypothetical protein
MEERPGASRGSSLSLSGVTFGLKGKFLVQKKSYFDKRLKQCFNEFALGFTNLSIKHMVTEDMPWSLWSLAIKHEPENAGKPTSSATTHGG